MHPDILGWAAAALMVATFSCREARWLRPLAVATNVAFIGYGLLAHLLPVLALHLLLLPINLWRCLQAFGMDADSVRERFERGARLLCTLALASLPMLAGCGGGGGDDGAGAAPVVPPSPPASSPAGALPPAGSGIGAAGGMARLADGAEVIVPAGALAQETAIEVTAGPAGAPALPPGRMALGKVYAFTPHGTAFAVPATVTVPFDPARLPQGVPPVLYKADAGGAAAGEWREVPGATVMGGAMQAQVTGFSYFAVAPPPSFMGVHRVWDISRLLPSWKVLDFADGHEDDIELSVTRVLGPVHLRTVGDQALGRIYGNATGSTYWLGVNSPAATAPGEATGGTARLEQHQFFEKRDEAATLSFVISQVWVHALDFDPRPPESARKLVRGYVDFKVQAWDQTSGEYFFHREGYLSVVGSYDEWLHGPISTSDVELWEDRHFDNVLGANPAARWVKLLQPLRITVPLDSVRTGGAFQLIVDARVVVQDQRQRESGVEAYFRDPQALDGGVGVEFTGLDRGDPHRGMPRPPYVNPPAAACAGAADAQAGTLQFESAAFSAGEGEPPGAVIVVTRTGGTRGRVSARVSTGGGTALPGTHYQPVSAHVAFADGHAGRRAVIVPIPIDDAAEPARTVQLTLDDVRGCAAPGALTSAILTIVDDDTPPPAPATYTVGGTVNGLAGSGLVLEDRAQFIDLPIAADGSFVFNRSYGVGAAYDVRVKSPPLSPAQACTVQRGSGIVGNAHVADIEVTCTTPPPPSGLDPGFGALGKVVDGLLGGARAIARQSTGHILATNGTSLVRYHPDGRFDAGFGGGAGKVDNLLAGTGADVADLVVLADDRIVVAGRVLQPGGPFTQMAAARFFADGARDTGFGSGGTATFRLAGLGENATRVLAQPDGRIVLVGQATPENGPQGQANNNVAVVRLNTDGSLDGGFGSGGAVMADALLRDFAFAAALQPDGRIFVAGRTSDNNADPTDTLFTRLAVDGAIEAGFGRMPAYSTLSDEAVDAALQPDGKIVLLVAARGLHNEILLARLNTDGSPDLAFGTDGTVRSDVGPHDDVPRAVAVQPDGRIVVAAQVSNALPVPPSFALLRYGADGAPDAGFGTAGVLRVPFFGGNDSANDLLVQPDGRIVVAGSWRSGFSSGIALVRLIP